MTATLENLFDHYKDNMPKMSSTISKIKTQMDLLEKTKGCAIAQAGRSFSTSTNEIDKLRTNVNTAASDLQQEHATLRTEVGKLSSLSGFTSGAPSSSQMSDMMQKISDLEGRISDDCFQLGGYTFSSGPELGDWCDKEKVVSCRMF
jgi:chromosome segregation ATPase